MMMRNLMLRWPSVALTTSTTIYFASNCPLLVGPEQSVYSVFNKPGLIPPGPMCAVICLFRCELSTLLGPVACDVNKG